MIEFRVEGMPPSYNTSFKINYGFREVYLSPEAKDYKTLVKMSMPPASLTTSNTYRVEIEYHGDFKYKNGKNRKLDLQNMDKILLDAIFEKLGVDDSYIYELQEKKVQETETYTKVKIDKL